MLVQVLFQLCESAIERAVGGAGIRRRLIVVRDLAQQPKLVAGMIMVHHHRGPALAARRSRRPVAARASYHLLVRRRMDDR